MNADQAKSVKLVYTRLIENEDPDVWSELDENLDLVEYMNDSELITECIIKFEQHSLNGPFRCKVDHDAIHCLAPHILDSVSAIIDLWNETDDLHPKNRYILAYYLCMSELRFIFNEDA